MTQNEILEALRALNERLAEEGTRAEICLYGGALMVLSFNARLSTRDVDAVFEPKDAVRKAAEAVSEDLGLKRDWLNDGVKGFLSENGEFAREGLPQFTHIQITSPTAHYLFAMKCLAARAPDDDTGGDKWDIILLMRKLGIATESEALNLVEKYYPSERIQPKTQFMILECLREIEKGPQEPA